MKKHFLLFGFFFLTISSINAQWEPKAIGTLPEDYFVSSISIVSDSIIWAVAIDYIVPTPPVPSDHLTKLLRSTDGGDNWEVIDIEEIEGRYSYDLHAFDENHAIITTQNLQSPAGRGLWQTEDGGENWSELLPGTAGGGVLHFFDDQEGICRVATIMERTTDGGENWTPVPSENIPPRQSGEISTFSTAGNAFPAVGNTLWFGTNQGRVFKSEDRGQTWTVRPMGLSGSFIYSMAFIDENNGIALHATNYQLAKTSDGGETWSPVSYEYKFTEVTAIPCANVFMGVSWEDSTTAISTDLGETWELLDDSTSAWAPTFKSPNLGWMAEGGVTGPNNLALYKWVGGSLNGRTYVNQNANGNNNGSSWADATTDLQVTLAAAEEGDEIWVAEGIYLPGSDSTATFLIDKNLKLYGGFAGTECNLNERDIELHPTILSGDLHGDDILDDYMTNRGDNTSNIMTITALVSDLTEISGFTFWGGHADFAEQSGGGIKSFGYPLISECLFAQNFAFNRGGGLYITGTDTNATARIEHCRFEKNHSNRGGGCTFNESNVEVIDCEFTENQSGAIFPGQPFDQLGGGVWTRNSNCLFKGCTFDSNSSLGSTGGLFYWVNWSGEGYTLEVDSCDFINNSGNSGSALYSQVFGKDNTTIVTNSNFNNNQILDGYGNVSLYHQQQGAYGSVLVDNCHFEGNTSENSSGAIDIGSGPEAGPSTYTIKNSTFKNNSAEQNFGAVSLWAEQNTDAVFHVDNCVFENNQSEVDGGGLGLAVGSDNFSATISRCVFIGNQSTKGGAVASFPDLADPAMPTLALLKMDNCLIADNISSNGAISFADQVNLDLLNCTVANNNSGGIVFESASALNLQNTILSNLILDEYTGPVDATITSKGGNLIGDSSFVDYALAYDLQNTDPLLDADYQPMAPNSPAIDKGIDLGNLSDLDLAGNPRIVGCVDIGAYESDVTVSMECLTDVEEVLVGEINLSPNPATDFIRLQLPKEIFGPTQVSLFDPQGKLIEQLTYSNGQPIQVDHLPAGFYTLKMVDGKQIYVGRFVKQ